MNARPAVSRPALERALLVLQVRAVCCSMNRTTTPDDRRWAARMADELAGLAVAARVDADTRGGPCDFSDLSGSADAHDFASLLTDIKG